jgi:outer membrane immunogenic protein
MDRGAQAAYVRPFTWTGFYVGGNVGYGWGDNNRVRDLDGYNPNGNFRIGDTDGASFGLQAGYNQQFQRIVVGIEGDGGFLGLTGAGQFPPFIGVRSPTDSAATVDMDYYGTITGRLGFTAGERLLIYGKAGWGWVRARQLHRFGPNWWCDAGLRARAQSHPGWWSMGWRPRIRPERLVFAEG